MRLVVVKRQMFRAQRSASARTNRSLGGAVAKRHDRGEPDQSPDEGHRPEPGGTHAGQPGVGAAVPHQLRADRTEA